MHIGTQRRHSTPVEEEQVGLPFTLRQAEDQSAPLFLLLHGRAGNRDVMWLFERALPKEATILSFQAPQIDPIGGFSWWDIATPGSSLRFAPTACALVADSFSRFLKHFRLSPQKTIALGFSQGAALLSVGAQLGTLPFDGFGLLAGFVVPVDQTEAKGGSEVRKVPVLIAHGTKDEVVPVEKAQEGRDALLAQGFPVTYVEDEVGHKVGVGAIRELTGWFGNILS
jgi:phospholipase/carboxylesterase